MAAETGAAAAATAGARGRAVLVGAGHAHLHALARAGEFARRGLELVVVAPESFWYSGLATGMLGGAYPPELDRVDVAALVRRGGGRFVRARAVAIDPAARTVRLDRPLDGAGGAGPATLRYDALSLTLGSEPPPIPGAAATPGCYAAKPIPRLRDLRLDLEARFRAGQGRPVRVAVAGGGVTAAELAANVAGLAARRGGRAEVVVLAGSGEPLRQLPARARRRVLAALRARGVEFRAGARVARVEPAEAGGGRAVLAGVAGDGEGEGVAFDAFVNATGLAPGPLAREAGLPVDAEGALVVDDRLRSVADPRVLGAGDCVAFRGRALPRVGVHAIRQAPVLFRNLLAALGHGGEPRRFAPQRGHLWIMNLGDGTGLAVRDPFWWHGRAAFLLKDLIDRRFLRAHQRAAGQAAVA